MVSVDVEQLLRETFELHVLDPIELGVVQCWRAEAIELPSIQVIFVPEFLCALLQQVTVTQTERKAVNNI